jgi:hypothetical protein
MPALYPSAVAPENFQIGECVRKWVTEWNVTPFTGIVTQVVPATYKVHVQWPIGNATPEDPETLIKVNPAISGMPTVMLDSGYDSAEKAISERDHGKVPHRITPSRDLTKPRALPLMPMMFSATSKMAIRIAHTFAEDTIGKLVGDICSYKKAGLSDITTYNRIFNKYGSYCSDHIIRSSIGMVYNQENK